MVQCHQRILLTIFKEKRCEFQVKVIGRTYKKWYCMEKMTRRKAKTNFTGLTATQKAFTTVVGSLGLLGMIKNATLPSVFLERAADTKARFRRWRLVDFVRKACVVWVKNLCFSTTCQKKDGSFYRTVYTFQVFFRARRFISFVCPSRWSFLTKR